MPTVNNEGAFRRRRAEEPVRLEPSSAFEALLLARIEALDERVSDDIAELKSRLNWLIVVIVGTCLLFILETILAV